jgi:hypothetical protein
MESAKRGREDEPQAAKVSRFSAAKYHNPIVPTYLPPEFILHDNGNALESFLLRATAADAKRLLDYNRPEEYFMRGAGEPLKVAPKYDLSGRRTNTYQQMLEDQRDKLDKDMQEKLKRVQAIMAAGSGLIAEREIVKKVYFTEEQMESRAYGAILGARGATHQKLEKETSTHIVLAGKGITDVRKKVNMRDEQRSAEMAEERPHCRITGTSEKSIQLAVQKVEWILSDDPEAIQFRDDNRRNLAMINGTYNAETWKATPIPGKDGQPGDAPAGDADVDDFLADL